MIQPHSFFLSIFAIYTHTTDWGQNIQVLLILGQTPNHMLKKASQVTKTKI